MDIQEFKNLKEYKKSQKEAYAYKKGMHARLIWDSMSKGTYTIRKHGLIGSKK